MKGICSALILLLLLAPLYAIDPSSSAVLTTPTPGSKLSNTTTNFTWSTGIGVTNYSLYVGTTPHAHDVAFFTSATATSFTVTNLPANGGTFYVDLYSLIAGVWNRNSYTYVATGAGVPSAMTGPANGSTLASSTATFTWTAGSGVSQYSLYIGTTKGAHDIDFFTSASALSQTFGNLPTNGGTFYVTLFSLIGGAWSKNSYQYIASGRGTIASITSPAPGSKLTSSTATFTWSKGSGVSQYSIYVGTAPGKYDIDLYTSATALSKTFTNLPSDGGTFYVTLFSYIGATWDDYVYNYVAVGTGVPAVMISPTSGTTLTGTSQLFTWTPGTGVSSYSLYVGSMPGKYDFFYSNSPATSVTAPIRHNCMPMYVTLRSLIAGVWTSFAYTYPTKNHDLVSVTVAGTSLMKAGETAQLTASGVFCDGTFENFTDDVTWTSKQPNVATVSSGGSTAGTAKALDSGSTDISASYPSFYRESGPLTLTVTRPMVGGQWVWTTGSDKFNRSPVYGLLGVPAPGNDPGGRDSFAYWPDSHDHLWLFGGFGSNGYRNDLWEFDPATSEWTWRSGSSGISQPGVYGTLGVPAPGNIPGSRNSSATWTDSIGHLWLFGGGGLNAPCCRNDLWEFDPSSKEWTWMSGSNAPDQAGVYGSKGVPAAANVPGARYSSVSWTDSAGHLWLFGGEAFNPSIGEYDNFNDLWTFDPTTRLWTWVSGSNTANQLGVYGTLGVPAAGNVPGARKGAVSWKDASGKLWLFGGQDTLHAQCCLNDLWRFDPATKLWTWMSGSSTPGQYGVYGTLGTPAAANAPGGRSTAVGWTDSTGHLWMLGGIGHASNPFGGNLNDLWEFNLATKQWTWMGGSRYQEQLGVYGVLGTPAPENTPGARRFAGGWIDSQGNLWFFGGFGHGSVGYENGGRSEGDLNDLWELQRTSSPPPAPSESENE